MAEPHHSPRPEIYVQLYFPPASLYTVACSDITSKYLSRSLPTHQPNRQSEWTAEITLPRLPHRVDLVSYVASDRVGIVGGLQKPISLFFLGLQLDSVREKSAMVGRLEVSDIISVWPF